MGRWRYRNIAGRGRSISWPHPPPRRRRTGKGYAAGDGAHPPPQRLRQAWVRRAMPRVSRKWSRRTVASRVGEVENFQAFLSDYNERLREQKRSAVN